MLLNCPPHPDPVTSETRGVFLNLQERQHNHSERLAQETNDSGKRAVVF